MFLSYLTYIFIMFLYLEIRFGQWQQCRLDIWHSENVVFVCSGIERSRTIWIFVATRTDHSVWFGNIRSIKSFSFLYKKSII